jgi:hypothetical protein
MVIFPIGIKLADDLPVQRPPYANPRNIVGPPDVATRIRASIAACHSAAS